MQIAMFLVLGLQVFPSRVIDVAPEGLLTAAVLVFVARPISVFVLTLPTRLSLKEKTFLSWVGLRGATPIIFATFTKLSDVELPLPIFDLVFFVVLVSVILQGATIVKLARRLGLLAPAVEQPLAVQNMKMAGEHIEDYLIQLSVEGGAKIVGQQILDIDLPENTLMIAIGRSEQIIIPRGGTIIHADDELLLLTDEKHHLQMRKLCAAPPYSESSGTN